MYYEARNNTIEQVDWPDNKLGQYETAKRIEDLDICQGIETAGMIFINDQHIDTSERIKEVAVLIKDAAGQHYQVESLTTDWMHPEELRVWINEHVGLGLEHAPFKRKVDFGPDRQAWFTCGCCGTGFQAVVKYQQQFDQDAGYGICKKCEKYYK